MAPNRRNHIPPSALQQRAPCGQPAGGDRGKTKSGKSVRTCFTSDLCSGNTLGSTSFLNFNLPTAERIPSTFLLSEKKAHIFNNIPLHQVLSFILPDGGPFLRKISAFLAIPHIQNEHFRHRLTASRPNYFHPIPGLNPCYGSRGERRFSGAWWPPVAGCCVNFQPNLQYILNRTNQACETNSSPAK